MNLEGKIIDFLGDSITEGHGVRDCVNNRYDNRLKAMCNLAQTYNYGIGGTRIAHQFKPTVYSPKQDLNFCARAYNLNRSADIIVVFGGTNDYGHGDAPFGSIGDKTPATFCGAVYFLMNYIKTEYADKTLVFITPAHREGDQNVPSRAEKQSDAKPLAAYVDVIVQTGKQLDVPVLNLFESLGIDPNNSEDMKKYAPDGLHFNDLGHEHIAKLLKDFLEQL